MKKLALAAAGVSAAASLFSSAAFATSPGAFAGGSNLYKAYNVTTNSDYSSVTTATCGQTVKYSIELSNTDYSAIKNITVKSVNGNVTVSGTNSEGQTTTSTGKITVNVDKGNLVYVNGSTVLRQVNGTNIKTLADGITTTGIASNDLAGSTRNLVQFQAKVDCPTTPTTPVTPTPETPKTPETPVTPTTPTELPSTGAGDAILPAFAIAAAAGASVYAVRARKLAK